MGRYVEKLEAENQQLATKYLTLVVEIAHAWSRGESWASDLVHRLEATEALLAPRSLADYVVLREAVATDIERHKCHFVRQAEVGGLRG